MKIYNKSVNKEEVNIPLAIDNLLKSLPAEDYMGSDGTDGFGDSIFMFEFKYKGLKHTITFK